MIMIMIVVVVISLRWCFDIISCNSLRLVSGITAWEKDK
jgi:hypothetical protein